MKKSQRLSRTVLLGAALVLILGVTTLSAGASSSIVINEMQVSTTSNDWEFVELAGPAGADLTGLTLIGVESDTGSLAGLIDVVISLDGQTIPSDGYWVGINSYGVTAYGISGDKSIANDSFENSTATYFLVSGFSAAKNTDLDTNNDGVLDLTPWTSVLDSLNIRDSGTTDFNYGAPMFGPDGSYLPSGTFRCPNGTGTFDGNLLNFSIPDGTPGTANPCGPAPEACGDAFTPIYEVQGSGLVSPYAGSEVAVEGVVIGDFQLNAQLKGFYLQDAAGDSDPATSDGVFVYASGAADVNIGDLVRVRGYVSEYHSMTEISGVSLLLQCSTGNPVTPIALSLPMADENAFEPYEGMLVTFPQTLYIAEYFNFDRYGEIVLTTDRFLTPTAEFEPGSPDIPAANLNYLLNRVGLDDGSSYQNPDPAIHPNGSVFDLSNLFRGGDEVANVTGMLDQFNSLYKVQPTVGADYTAANPRLLSPDDVGGGLKVASFNVLNYFTTLNSRGANTVEEFVRQRTKIIAAISEIDADVVGLIEIENNTEAIADLVTGLNDLMGAGTYAYIDTGVIGTDEIKVAFIYKPTTVSLVGGYAILDSSVDPRFIDTLNRPALAQSFQDDATGGIFTVVVNHLKSKGSACDGDPDLGDGSGNCNLTRLAAAEALVDWLATDPTGSGDSDFIIMGDLNAYDKEAPIDAILAGPDDLVSTGDDYTDTIFAFLGEDAYSYLYDGRLGYLDHALANPGLFEEISGVTVWHINADEPDLIDYDMSYKKTAQDALYEPNAFRSSDHDPVIVGLNVCDEIAPTISISVTPDTLWPANHTFVTVTAAVTVSDNFDPNPAITLVSVVSNEPDNGPGDGNTKNDIRIVDDFTFRLRAERSALGTGRIYTITYMVSDACGNETFASVEVFVPLNQKPAP